MKTESKLYTASEAMALLRICRTTFYELLKTNAINTRKIGRKRYVTESELKRLGAL